MQPRQPPSIRSPRAPAVAFAATAPADASSSTSAPSAASSTLIGRHSCRQAGGIAAYPLAVSAGLWTESGRRGLPSRIAEATESTATVGAGGVGRSNPRRSASPSSTWTGLLLLRLPSAATCYARGVVVEMPPSKRDSSIRSMTFASQQTHIRGGESERGYIETTSRQGEASGQ